MNPKPILQRIPGYVIGMTLLAVGLTLTAQTGLGASPLTSVAFVLAQWLHWPFADMTLAIFSLFVLAQVAMLPQKTWKSVALLLMQLPLSVLFTRVMHLAQRLIDLTGFSTAARFLFLLLAIVLTGVGAAMTLRADLIPNPGDGVVKALSVFLNKPLGVTKNVFDACNVAAAAALSLMTMGRLTGVHVGSAIAMLGVGRVICLYQKLTPNDQRPSSNQE